MSAPYELQLVVPANTPQSSPVSVGLDPDRQRIIRVELMFPDGCLFAIGVRIRDRDTPYAPKLSGWVRGNDQMVAWDDEYVMHGPPPHLTIEAYSDADDYPHTIEARIFVG